MEKPDCGGGWAMPAKPPGPTWVQGVEILASAACGGWGWAVRTAGRRGFPKEKPCWGTPQPQDRGASSRGSSGQLAPGEGHCSTQEGEACTVSGPGGVVSPTERDKSWDEPCVAQLLSPGLETQRPLPCVSLSVATSHWVTVGAALAGSRPWMAQPRLEPAKPDTHLLGAETGVGAGPLPRGLVSQ